MATCIRVATLLAACLGLVETVHAEIATQLRARGSHACVITAAGGVACWGENGGALGDGTTTARREPVPVVGLPAGGIATVVPGWQHTCAVTSAGALLCWGENGDGRLGDGTTSDRLTPVAVSGLGSGVAAVAAGGVHTCALTTGGAVKCWGGNLYGGLGDGTWTPVRTTPVDVVGLESGVTAIAVGGAHSCALTSGGGVKCWGLPAGDGEDEPRNAPVDVVGLGSGVTAIVAGASHTCALTAAGGVKCWTNGGAPAGDGSAAFVLSPVDVVGLESGVSALWAGDGHTCARTTGGALKCWGFNHRGQVGDGTDVDRLTPVDVVGLPPGVVELALGASTTCARTAAGAVSCWGLGRSGQLGHGLGTAEPFPVPVVGLGGGVAAIGVGTLHSCSLSTAGAVSCWGENVRGKLGDGTTMTRPAPVAVPGAAAGVQAVVAGLSHTCVLTVAGGAKCWGGNDNGQLGDGTLVDRSTPTDVTGLGSGVVALSAGFSQTCALLASGGVKCWGGNLSGEVGDGTNATMRTTPVDVVGLGSGVVAVSAGARHTCALMATGAVRCWGANERGQVGDGTTTKRTAPVAVVGLASGVTAIDAGGIHSCARLASGAMKCWGGNADGGLGDGTTVQRPTPVDVVGLPPGGVSAIALGSVGTCALTATSGVLCWGGNVPGYLPLATADRAVPVPVVGFETGVSAVSLGEHACVLTSAGAVFCWGSNPHGQVGNGTMADSYVPVAVVSYGETCGDGALDPGEQCDDGNRLPGDCCDPSCQLGVAAPCLGDDNRCTSDTCDAGGVCQHAPQAGSCEDGVFCNGADACDAGACVHAGDPCAGGGECAGACDEAANTCFLAAGTPCSDDGETCTADVCDGVGACAHPAGNAGTVCRAAGGPCDVAETCTGASPSCPIDGVHVAGTACVPDGETCTADVCDGAGTLCTHPAGNAGTPCRAANPADPCDVAEACDGVAPTCPADVGAPDGDADGECDGRDPCTGGQPFTTRPTSRLALKAINTDPIVGNDQLTLSGSFALPSGRVFTDFRPDLRGLRLVVETHDGTRRVDVVLAPGTFAGGGTRGWRLSGGKAWAFVDKTGAPVNGIAKVKIVNRDGATAPRQVKVQIVGKKGVYPVVEGDQPLRAIVTLGDPSDAALGLCGETGFGATACAFDGRRSSITCR